MKIVLDGSYSDYLMRCNGFSCGFNMPPATKSLGKGDGEMTWGLPPYNKRMPFLVDEYPACPDNWMRSEGKVKSFFVPVKEGYGMWLDFNGNESHTNHVAILISVQGVNPITGMPCKDGQLEQYIEECPKHNVKFGPDRYCKKCDYKWPKQNYITTTTTPGGQIWLDGFRTAEGVVRQYLLTQEKMRGVANNIIGKDRVFAIGISFFLSKEKKPVPVYTHTYRGDVTDLTTTMWGGTGLPIMYGGAGTMDMDYLAPRCLDLDDSNDSNTQPSGGGTSSALGYTGTLGGDQTKGCYSTKSAKRSTKLVAQAMVSPVRCSGSKGGGASADTTPQFFSPIHTPINWQVGQAKQYDGTKVATKQIEVGAGAKLNQQVYDDSEKLEFWHNESEAMICVNYVLESDAVKIIKAGKVEIKANPEGFLQKCPVGN